MIYEALKTLHLLLIVVWVGGMVFSHFFLRPAVIGLEPSVRLTLMRDVLRRFFQAVLAASVLTLITGVWMLGRVAKNTVQSGGGFQMPFDWTVMTVLGVAPFNLRHPIRVRALGASCLQPMKQICGCFTDCSHAGRV